MNRVPLRRSTSESSFLSLKFPLKSCRIPQNLDDCIFVANLNANVSNQQLASDVYSLFSSFGDLFPVKVSRDSMGRPFAFVNFKNGQSVEGILHQRLYLHSRLLRMEKTKSNSTLEIVNVNELYYETLEEIQQFLLNFGPIQQISLVDYSLYCSFSIKQNAISALLFLRENGIHAYLRKQTSTLWVGNLPGYLEFKQDLQDLFSNFGPLEHVQLYNGVCNENPYAFITFQNPSDAFNALCLNGVLWRNRILQVRFQDSKSLYPQVSKPRLSQYAPHLFEKSILGKFQLLNQDQDQDQAPKALGLEDSLGLDREE